MLQAVRPTTTENEGDGVTEERRESERWTSPRIILTVLQLFIGFAGLCVSILGFLMVVGGGLLGVYVVSQTKDATSEMSNAQLAQQIGQLSIKFDKLNDAVTMNTQTSTRETTELKNDVATLRRDLDKESEERKGRDGWLEARIVSGK